MSLKKQLQTLRIAMGKKLLDKEISPQNQPIQPKKILFIRKDGKIGDFMVSSFVYREIKKADPSIQIGVICSPKNQALFANNPHIDQLYLLPSRKLCDHYRLGKQLAGQYDTVIDPTVFLRNRDLLLLKLLNAKNYIGYQKANYQLFTHSIEENVHFSQLYRQALALCGIQNVDTQYAVPSNPESEQRISQFLAKNQLTHYIVVNFFGAPSAMKFTEQNIKKWLDFLQKNPKKLPLVILTYPAVTPLLKKCIAGRENIFIDEQTQTIFDSIALIRNADWIISPDTSIMHIASGFNKNIIGFYRQNNESWANWQPTTKGKCHICFFEKNINEITPEQVDLAWLAE